MGGIHRQEAIDKARARQWDKPRLFASGLRAAMIEYARSMSGPIDDRAGRKEGDKEASLIIGGGGATVEEMWEQFEEFYVGKS